MKHFKINEVKTTICKIFISWWLVLFMGCSTVFAQNFDTISLTQNVSVLNKKAFFKFPAQAQIINQEIGAYPDYPKTNEETRIVINFGEIKLSFLIREGYVLTNNNLLTYLTEENRKFQLKTQILTNSDSVQSFFSTPIHPDSIMNPPIVSQLFIKTQDNTAFSVFVTFNSAGYPFRSEFIKLTEKIYKTLSKGTRIVNLKARQETIKIAGTNKSFQFNIPANYGITIQQQYNLQSIKFHHYGNFTSDNLTISVGNNPEWMYEHYELSEKYESRKVSGNFLDKKIEWLQFYVHPINLIIKEQKFVADYLRQGLITHVLMESNHQTAIDELTKIIENMRLVE
jgi:hypothetical protein